MVRVLLRATGHATTGRTAMIWLRTWHRDWCNYRRLSAQEKRSLLLAMLLLPFVVLIHRVLGLRRAQAVLDFMATDIVRPAIYPGPSESERMHLVRSISRIVEIASRRCLFTPTCLQRSILLRWWLARRGIASSLRFGVRKRDGTLEAHAWVEHTGQVLNDVPNIGDRFAPFDSCFAAASRSTQFSNRSALTGRS